MDNNEGKEPDSKEKNILSRDDEQKEKEEEEKYEKIMDKATFSRNRTRIMITMVFLFIADGMEMSEFNFIIKPFGDYFLLEESDVLIQVASSSLYLGIAFGSGIASFLTKKFGRIKTINVSNTIWAISHLLHGVFLNMPLYIICRSIIGFTLGVIIPIYMNIFGEYCPPKYRGFLLMVCWAIFGFGQLALSVIGLLVMPELQPSRLQAFILILSIFAILSCIICFIFLKDSPRGILLSKKTWDRSKLSILMEEVNKIDTNENQENKLQMDPENGNDLKESYSLKQIIIDMFSPDLKKTTILLIFMFIIIGYNAFGMFTVASYFLDYLAEKENDSNSNETKDTAKDIIVNQIFLAASTIVANLVGGFFGEIKKLGRKGGIIVFAILASIVTIIGIFSKILFEITSPISMGCTHIFVNLIMDYTVEIYPTKIRDTSTSLLFMIYRISSFIFNFIGIGLYKANVYIPYIIFSIFSILLFVFTLSLPYEMAGKSMK